MAASIFNGNAVKILKNILRFKDNTELASSDVVNLSGLTGNVQTQLDAKVDSSLLGANNGVATLDSGGKVPVSQLPSSIMEYKGTWAASTNTPTLANGVGDVGDVYIASDDGTVNFGAGPISFTTGDWVIYNGSIWQKSGTSAAVVSVNGQTGIVSLTTSDISEGSNLYFTNELAQDAVGATLDNTSTISLTYNDAAPSITATVNSGSITNTEVSGSAGIELSKLAAVTASRALVSDGSGIISPSAVTSTELGYVSGVTSSIQTQIDGKMTNPMTTGGDIIYGGASGTPTRLANGSAGNVLTSSGGTAAPTWASPNGTLAYTANTGAITLSASNDTLVQSGASANITLPSAASNPGKIFRIVHNGTSLSQVYTLLTTGGDTVNGLASGGYVLRTNQEMASFQSDGVSNWKQIEHITTGPEMDLGTLTISAASGGLVKGTTTVDKVTAVRSGNRVRLTWRYQQTAGSSGTGNYTVTLPTNITLDTTYITPSNAFTQSTAQAAANFPTAQMRLYTTTGPTSGFDGYIYPLTSTTLAVFMNSSAGGGNFWSSTAFGFGLAFGFTMTIELPVSGWQP